MEIVVSKDGRPCKALTKEQLAVVHDDIVAFMNRAMGGRRNGKATAVAALEKLIDEKLTSAGLPLQPQPTEQDPMILACFFNNGNPASPAHVQFQAFAQPPLVVNSDAYVPWSVRDFLDFSGAGILEQFPPSAVIEIQGKMLTISLKE